MNHKTKKRKPKRKRKRSDNISEPSVGNKKPKFGCEKNSVEGITRSTETKKVDMLSNNPPNHDINDMNVNTTSIFVDRYDFNFIDVCMLRILFFTF